MAITIEPMTGTALAQALPTLARLRITVFRDWPYLYDGTLNYEQDYLARFAQAKNAVVVAARDDEVALAERRHLCANTPSASPPCSPSTASIQSGSFTSARASCWRTIGGAASDTPS